MLPAQAQAPAAGPGLRVRHTAVRDFPRIREICHACYPAAKPWSPGTLMQHLEIFARGQLVVVDAATDRVVGSASSLVVHWSDYGTGHTWNQITGDGTFRTHDSTGTTLYGADVIVDPAAQGRGVGKLLYAARRQVAADLNLSRIRAMARLQGYHLVADRMTPAEYAAGIAEGRWTDPTVSFQVKQGFRLLKVASGYMSDDDRSQGHAVVIEWLNPAYDAQLG
ncbi:GNAT family N-acetyltransferase [Phycisphaera mikurensis]|uniref:Putative acetyltransferase n=1 Tax=Phycisphaera mikurensis (strain NBRC 102666 / KCTC 22515 / FYK2301M01) TaxID=1142394 RepID=I0IBM5_PHYMF|nr:GNAT family N-acetyltransferase [Phycisphaera mikurensis]MBB6442808.1 GNAT superfamily N-acetyltransferase [Phycisphaera mikurensis]BAM02663.1 putative acetyltransferase [Phycisphaera mikurensis NBRC 102666]